MPHNAQVKQPGGNSEHEKNGTSINHLNPLKKAHPPGLLQRLVVPFLG
jgi:hypothetical protein